MPTTRIAHLTLCLFALIFIQPLSAATFDELGCVDDEVAFETGYGCWVYHDNGANADKPVRVWYYYPPNFAWGSGQVLFAMHGSSRDATEAIERWVSHADQFGALLIAPEFSKAHFPKGRHYTRGYVRNDDGTIRTKRDWTFSTIEEIFTLVRENVPGAPGRYSIQGHSAGAQFVQRHAMLAGYRIDKAVAANAGWYLLPDTDLRYPCGISNIVDRINTKALYRRNLILTLGTADSDPNAPGVNHGRCADSQGASRYERGHFIYQYTRDHAQQNDLDYRWSLVDVAGVAHNADDMVPAAAAEIFANAAIDAQTTLLTPFKDSIVKASYPSSNYGSRSVLQVDGNSKKTTYMAFDLSAVGDVATAILRIKVTDGSRGTQTIRQTAANWSEGGLTYANRPGDGAIITQIPGAARGWLSIDVTTLVQARRGGIASILIESDHADGMYFYSRESAEPPELEIFH